MSQVSSEMFAAFGALQTKFESGEAMTGVVERPEEGIHDCIVKDMVLTEDKFRLDDAGQEVKSQNILFRYQLINDPTRKVPLEFPGKGFNLPLSTDGFAENKAKQVEMDLRRLKGHLKSILNMDEDPPNLILALTEAMKKIKNPQNAVAVSVRCQYDLSKDKTKTYFKEYIVKSLSK